MLCAMVYARAVPAIAETVQHACTYLQPLELRLLARAGPAAGRQEKMRASRRIF